MNLRLRLAIEWFAIGLIASFIVMGTLLWRGTDAFDNVLYDRLTSVTRPAADKDALIVAIDDHSLKTIGKWPWGREIHARLIERLQKAQPRTITFDILLSETGDVDPDAALADAMSAGSPVYLPMHFVSPGNDGRAFDPAHPAPMFAAAAEGVGHANLSFDADGIVRRAALCFQPEPDAAKMPHLMELVVRTSKAKPSAAYQGGKCGQELLVPYARRGSFAEVSYADVLAGNVPPALIAGRDVIVGATAAGMGDSFSTPNGDGGLLSGVEIMANMLGALKRDDFIAPLNGQWVMLLSLLPLWLLLAGFIRLSPRAALGMSLLSIAAVLLASAAMLSARIWFAPGAALLGVLLVYPLWGWRRLQAMSDFMMTELGALEKEAEVSPLPLARGRATDLVGRQSENLASAIDQMRDLRRFVADTLADLPDPMFVTDPEDKVTLSNRLLDERIGQPIAGLKLGAALDEMVASGDRPAVDAYLDKRQSSEFVRFVSPHSLTFVMRRSEVRSDAGVLHGHIHYLTDITALAKAEAEREEVLQLLSHDMRAPQSTIIALLDGEIDADAKKRIESNARRTMQLAQDFVDIARMAETEFDGDDVLLAELMRDSADNLWPLAKERGIRIEVADNSDCGFVIAETDTLCRAIANLLDNAIKFSPDGGTIQIAIHRMDIDGAPWISASISDQGKGIAVDLLPRLFSRFATGGEHQGRVRGTGLGMTFVKAVIARHGGQIRAENVAGQGARFTFELPEAPED